MLGTPTQDRVPERADIKNLTLRSKLPVTETHAQGGGREGERM